MSKTDYDIIVVGGGMPGVAAACAAAREGRDVLLIERYGFLGGMSTAGLVNPFMTYYLKNPDGKRDFERDAVNKGLFAEILKGLLSLDGLEPEYRRVFNEEMMKLVLDRMTRKYGVNVLFHTYLCEAERSGDRITGIKAVNKNGVATYTARYFIDATGDADLVSLGGGEWVYGRESDQLCQPMTLCFRLANVDAKNLDRSAVNKAYQAYRQNHQMKNPRDTVLIFDHMVDDVLHFNSTRVLNKRAVNAEELSEAEMEAREQAYELLLFMKENIPGFENAQMLMTAAQIGVRESRRVVGHYLLTADDLMDVVKFSDSIARGAYGIDIHDPTGSSAVVRYLPPGEYYTIPYRSIIPISFDNVIIAGRPISATHEGHSAMRVLPIVTCIGEAAGIASALAFEAGAGFINVDASKIQTLLEQYGGLY